MNPLEDLKKRLQSVGRHAPQEEFSLMCDAIWLAEFLNDVLTEVALKHSNGITRLWAQNKIREASKLFNGKKE